MITTTVQLYEGRPDVSLTTYVLADSPELMNGKRRPAVLICPGGAYLNCSDREAEPVALRFAAMGYHAFVLRYSTYFKGEARPIPAAGQLGSQPEFHPSRTHARHRQGVPDHARSCGRMAGGHG